MLPANSAITTGGIMSAGNKHAIEAALRQPSIAKFVGGLAVLAAAILAVLSSVYTVEEGHVGIVKRFGKAVEQVEPGIHGKLPFIDVVEEVEVRTRRNLERLPASTSEQMPVTAEVSVNWTANREAALDLYQRYGSLAQFEERVLDPRLRSASKQAMAQFKAEEIIQNRGAVISAIEKTLLEEMQGFPVKLDSAQLENVEFPHNYLQSIEAKQTAKNLADAEKHRLEQQNLQAQQAVNTANAERDAAKARADGEAYSIAERAAAEAKAIRLKGEAEATAIRAKTEALKGNAALVEYTRAERWDGVMPTMVVGSGAGNIMWQMTQPAPREQ